MPTRMTIAAALESARKSVDGMYGVLLARGTLELGFYKPDGIDPQQPHERDELYIVHSGSGSFVCDGRRQPFEPGEALFVPAGVTHRFEDFTDDFSAWVLFYGPVGAETPGAV